jgi:hypothetical protein
MMNIQNQESIVKRVGTTSTDDTLRMGGEFTMDRVKEMVRNKNLTKEQQRSRKLIDEKEKDQNRLRLHNRINIRVSEAADYWKMVTALLVKEKVEQHKHFFKIQPLPTYGLISDIKKELRAVFDPKKKYTSIKCNDSDRTVIEKYVDDISLNKFIAGEIFESYFSDFNGFCVIDLPNDGEIKPYPYIVDIADVELFGEDAHNEVSYIVYKRNGNYIYLDALSFVVFDNEKRFVGEFYHYADQCLAFKLFPNGGALQGEAGNLNFGLFKMLDYRKLSVINSSPVSWSYRGNCNYTRVISDKTREICDNGDILRISDNDRSRRVPTGLKCPKCATNLSGAGTHLYIGLPEDNEKPLGDPMGYVFPDMDVVEKNKTFCDEIYNNIFKRVTGGEKNANDSNNTAYNEKQVMSMIESKRNVLTQLGRSIGRIESLLISKIGTVLLGYPVTANANYGNDFFNIKESDTYSLYTDAVKIDASSNIKQDLYDNWIQTKNRNNESGYLRDRMMSDICPYFHESFEKLNQMNSSGLANVEDVYFKFNFDRLIKEYERVNGKIEAIKQDNYEKKVETVKAYIYSIIKNERNDIN